VRNGSPRRATIGAVAGLAGVSTATVSRVLSGGSPVSEATRLKVRAAAESLNYRPSDLTRAIFAGRSDTIGVLLADMRNPYYIDLIDGISQVTNAAETLSYLTAGNRDLATERRLLALMDSHRVRGLITTVASNANEDIIHQMAESGTECVYITRRPSIDHPRIHSIRLDDLAAGELAWDHLTDIGRRNVLVVNQGLDRPTITERAGGLTEAARRAGHHMDARNIYTIANWDAADHELERRLLDGHADGSIDAVFATTGIATFRAYEALSRTGLSVPGDIAMLGLDDFAWADHLRSPLSVIVQPTIEMGRTAAQVILAEPGESRRLTFAPSLSVRASTTV
jgi:LacI family transcriptional regulator